jgi:phage gpG-like protein
MGRRPFTGLKAETKTASGVIRTKLTVDPPAEALGRAFETIGLSAKHGFLEVWEKLIPVVISEQRRIWASRGGAVGSPWAAYAPKYRKNSQAAGGRAANLILTGYIHDTVTTDAGVMKVHPNYLRFGVIAKGAAKHQFGNKNKDNKFDALEPQRTFLSMTEPLKSKAQDLLTEYISYIVQQAFRVEANSRAKRATGGA